MALVWSGPICFTGNENVLFHFFLTRTCYRTGSMGYMTIELVIIAKNSTLFSHYLINHCTNPATWKPWMDVEMTSCVYWDPLMRRKTYDNHNPPLLLYKNQMSKYMFYNHVGNIGLAIIWLLCNHHLLFQYIVFLLPHALEIKVGN